MLKFSFIFLFICIYFFHTNAVVLIQPSRHRPPVVPHPLQGSEASHVRPVPVADYQDCHCSAAASPFCCVPLQYAWLYGEEDARGLKLFLDYK